MVAVRTVLWLWLLLALLLLVAAELLGLEVDLRRPCFSTVMRLASRGTASVS